MTRSFLSVNAILVVLLKMVGQEGHFLRDGSRLVLCANADLTGGNLGENYEIFLVSIPWNAVPSRSASHWLVRRRKGGANE